MAVKKTSRRIQRNAVIGLASAALTAVVFQLAGDTGSPFFRWSMGTGYASAALIGLALGLGPWWVHRGRRPPVSTHFRRDVGLWAAALAMIHVAVGLQVHAGGDMVSYFLYPPGGDARVLPLRFDGFGLANWAGLAATAALVFLSVISNDRALRALGAAKWKRLQQWTYPTAVVIALHAVAYQIVEGRAVPFVIGFGLLVGLVLGLQLYGRWLRRTPPARPLR